MLTFSMDKQLDLVYIKTS